MLLPMKRIFLSMFVIAAAAVAYAARTQGNGNGKEEKGPEIPTLAVMAGGALVTGSGLYIWFRETRQLKRAAELKPRHPEN